METSPKKQASLTSSLQLPTLTSSCQQPGLTSSCQQPSLGFYTMANLDDTSRKITGHLENRAAKSPKPRSTLAMSVKSKGKKRAGGHHEPKGKAQEDCMFLIKDEEVGMSRKRKVTEQVMLQPESTHLDKGEKPKNLDPDVIIDLTSEDSDEEGPKPKALKQDLTGVETDDQDRDSGSHQNIRNHKEHLKSDDGSDGWKQPCPIYEEVVYHPNRKNNQKLLDTFKEGVNGNSVYALPIRPDSFQSQVDTLNIKGRVEGQSYSAGSTQVVLKKYRVVKTMEYLCPATTKKRHLEDEDKLCNIETSFVPEHTTEKKRRHDLEPEFLDETSAQTFLAPGCHSFVGKKSSTAVDEREKPVFHKEHNAQDYLQLPAQMEEEVRHALGPGPEDEVLSAAFKLRITRADIHTLNSQQWLNDEVINFYMNLLVERNKKHGYASLHAFNTFFYSKLKYGGYPRVKRWTERVNIFEKEILLVPIHRRIHWSLVVIDLRRKSLTYLDSMGQNGDNICQILFQYLRDESRSKRKIDLNPLEWSLYSMGPGEIPQQRNGSDCGIFACKYADYISRDQPITFNQEQMPFFRRKMVWEILHHQIMG